MELLAVVDFYHNGDKVLLSPGSRDRRFDSREDYFVTTLCFASGYIRSDSLALLIYLLV